jgi:hypothetical protein
MGNSLPALAATFLLTTAVFIQAADPPNQIDVSRLPAQIVEDVVVPVPSEVFNVLDRLGSPNWHRVLRPVSNQTPAERPRIALMLGTVIAEGFIAVEAQDGEEVKKIGREVLKLAGAIGVRKHVVARTESIIEGADAKNWQKVKMELDGALHDVRSAMKDLNDDALAHLVSLGGWLRGTEAVTEVVQRNYTKEQSELLHQPALLDYFQTTLGSMGARFQQDRVVAKIKKGLPEIQPLIKLQDGAIAEASVKQINQITSDLVKSVISKD